MRYSYYYTSTTYCVPAWTVFTTYFSTYGTYYTFPQLLPISTFPSTWWYNYTDITFSGAGTEGSPWLITTAEELAGISSRMISDAAYRDDYYKLTADINLSTNLWRPISYNSSYTFTGQFDGDGFVISGLRFNYNSSTYCTYAGLFGYTVGATFKNITLVDTYIYNYVISSLVTYTGSVVAYMDGGTITNCSNNGTVVRYSSSTSAYSSYVGGIIGGSTGYLSIKNCYNNATVTSSFVNGIENYTGGIIGAVSIDGEYGPRIYGSYNTGSINATNYVAGAYTQYVGGIVGHAGNSGYYGSESKVVGSANVGDITVTGQTAIWFTGGIVGYLGTGDQDWQNIQYSYNKGKIKSYTGTTASSYFGGIVGRLENGGMDHLYNTAHIEITSGTAYGIGERYGSYTMSYYNVFISSLTSLTGTYTSWSKGSAYDLMQNSLYFQMVFDTNDFGDYDAGYETWGASYSLATGFSSPVTYSKQIVYMTIATDASTYYLNSTIKANAYFRDATNPYTRIYWKFLNTTTSQIFYSEYMSAINGYIDLTTVLGIIPGTYQLSALGDYSIGTGTVPTKTITIYPDAVTLSAVSGTTTGYLNEAFSHSFSITSHNEDTLWKIGNATITWRITGPSTDYTLVVLSSSEVDAVSYSLNDFVPQYLGTYTVWATLVNARGTYTASSKSVNVIYQIPDVSIFGADEVTYGVMTEYEAIINNDELVGSYDIYWYVNSVEQTGENSLIFEFYPYDISTIYNMRVVVVNNSGATDGEAQMNAYGSMLISLDYSGYNNLLTNSGFEGQGWGLSRTRLYN